MLNPNPLDISEVLKHFTEQDTWGEFYPDAEEEIPSDRPEVPPDSKRVQITIFVDADHAHCEVTRRSVTGIVGFVNSTPVKWYSKIQKTVETSTPPRGSSTILASTRMKIFLISNMHSFPGIYQSHDGTDVASV